MMKMGHLSNAQLRRLEEHKYSCASSSLMDPMMQKWWCWLVEQISMTLAPNLITIAGLFINIVTSLLLVYYSPDAKQEVPRWACFLCALGLFIYQSLDAIDGKQARRTGTSSPLGELFDHGCDSLSTGTLRFGYVDVTEAQFGVIIIHLITVIFGPGVWSVKVFLTDYSDRPLSASGLGGYSADNILVCVMMDGGSICIYSLLKAERRHGAGAPGTQRA
ncbi:cholinephosphotransferase 1-like isoform X4 [Procambarus clarkii]|uniref:cholinephosphotransferase 1-like isoform X4 n=1 Tax=Procambarus clarkii TaxID=6728 RepID=UPI003743A224